MDIKEKENRKKFKDLLYELGSSLDVLKSPYKRSEIYTRLESLYHNTDFRHYYSDIFSVLTTIKQDNTLGDIDILGQNLTIIKNGYKSINKDADGNQIDIQKQINKLFDHVSLDIARISYSDAANRQSVQDSKINDIKREINETQRRVDSMLNDIEVSQINIKTTQDRIRVCCNFRYFCRGSHNLCWRNRFFNFSSSKYPSIKYLQNCFYLFVNRVSASKCYMCSVLFYRKISEKQG